MQTQALGGGVLLAIGAVLWALYFLPTWVKRRQFTTAQKNALRIHRTLRILAETSEIPEEVRVEATARQALAHERMLEATGRSAVAEHEAKLAEAKLAEQKAILEAKSTKRRADALKRELIRRSHPVKIIRQITAALLVLGILGLIVGLVLTVVGLGSTVLSVSAAVSLVSILSLVVMAPRQPVAAPDTASVAPKSIVAERRTPVATRRVATAHLNSGHTTAHRTTRAPANSSASATLQPASADQVAQAKQLLELARKQAERDARAAQPAAASSNVSVAQADRVQQRAPQRPGAPLRPAATVAARIDETVAQATAFRSMGIVDETAQAMPDLDAVLSRRRNAS